MSLDTLISTQKTKEQEEEVTKETILNHMEVLRTTIAY